MPDSEVAIYNDRVVCMDYVKNPKDRFKFACQRISDNGFEGHVVCPNGDVFSVTKSSRLAKPVRGNKAEQLRKIAAQPKAIPELEACCNSWIVTRRSTGEVIGEFDQRSNVEKFNPEMCLIETALTYLGRINKAIEGSRI